MFSLQFPVDGYCHCKFTTSISLKELNEDLGNLNSSSCPLLKQLVHIGGEEAQLSVVKSPGYEQIDLSTWCLSEALLPRTEYGVMLLILFWHNLRFCFPEHQKKSSERKQKRFNWSIVISRVSLEAVVSEVFIYKRHYIQIWYQELCGTVKFLTCIRTCWRNLPLSLQYGYSTMQTVILKPICHISATFSTLPLGSLSSLYPRRDWL